MFMKSRMPMESIDEFKNNLARIMSNLTQASPGELKLNPKKPGFVIYHYHAQVLPPGIQEMALLCNGKEKVETNEFIEDYKYSYLRLIDTNGLIRYYPIQTAEELKTLISPQNNAFSESLSIITKIDESIRSPFDIAIDWKPAGIDPIYDDSTHLHYVQLHNIIADTLYDLLKDRPDISKIRLIELGCGNGKALHKAATYLLKNLVSLKTIHCVAADYSPTNVGNTEKFFHSEFKEHALDEKKTIFLAQYADKPISYEVRTLDSTSSECLKLLSSKKEGFTDIVIASGHLTRLVLNNIHEAQLILSNLSHGNIPYFITGGQREEICPFEMVRQMGFTLKPFEIVGRTIHLFQPIASEHPEIERLKRNPSEFKSSQQFSFLNLSMSTDPIRDLKEAIKHPAASLIETIDLSYSELFRSSDESTLLSLCNKLPNLKNIIFCTTSIEEYGRLSRLQKSIPTMNIYYQFSLDERLKTLPPDFITMLDKHSLETQLGLLPEMIHVMQHNFNMTSPPLVFEAPPATKPTHRRTTRYASHTLKLKMPLEKKEEKKEDEPSTIISSKTLNTFLLLLPHLVKKAEETKEEVKENPPSPHHK